nr:actin cytoskeleton-regulatory complex protein PAN1-like [Aegilops tauschii subsp. strangulata]
MVSVAPLSLERSPSASVIGAAEGSTNNRRIDPAADLREAQEKNAWEVREEKEAAAKKAEADKAAAAKAAQADADAEAKAQADTATKKRAEDATRQQIPQLITPLRSTPPAPEISAPAGGAGDEKPVTERERGDAILRETEAPPQPPTADAQGSQPTAPLVPPAGGELMVGSAPMARTPVRCRVEKAASAPRPMEVGSASSSAPKAEASSATPTELVHGGGTSALIKAAQDVQGDCRSEATALSQCMKAFVKTHATVRDYHNIHAATFNANVRELDRRTAGLMESRKANAALQQRLGEANTALRAKEDECNRAAQERDRLAKELKDQAELHKAALKQVEDNEARLLAEFETERSGWAETEAALTAGYGKIEDIVDDFFPSHSIAANQAIEARCEERRAEGAEIAANAPRTLGEQLLSIQEASAELVAVERALSIRASAIAEYTNTGVFVPELNENGVEVPLEWFGLNPDDGEDSAEEIASSDEGEDEEDEDDEDGAPEVRAGGQPQLDRASSTEPRASMPTVAEGDQAETRQPATPPAGALDCTNLPDSPAAPLV